MMNPVLACPNCKSKIKRLNAFKIKCLGCKKSFQIKSGIPILLAGILDNFKLLEANYHTKEAEHYSDTNMISSPRVIKYHKKFLHFLKKMPKKSVILEVAGGDGTDAKELIKSGLTLIHTDISIGMVKAAKSKSKTLEKNKIFIVCDAEKLPSYNNSLDGILIVGALHHLPSPEKFFIEAKRTLKPGGLLIVGFEPNVWPYKYLYPALKKLSKHLKSSANGKVLESSIGDQQTNGFSNRNFQFFASKSNLRIIDTQRIWYLNGFIHLALSHLNNRRIRDKPFDLPAPLQRIIIFLDDFIAKVPFLNRFCWHWTYIFEKQ